MTREKVHNKKQIKTDKEIYEELSEKEKKVYQFPTNGNERREGKIFNNGFRILKMKKAS